MDWTQAIPHIQEFARGPLEVLIWDWLPSWTQRTPTLFEVPQGWSRCDSSFGFRLINGCTRDSSCTICSTPSGLVFQSQIFIHDGQALIQGMCQTCYEAVEEAFGQHKLLNPLPLPRVLRNLIVEFWGSVEPQYQPFFGIV